MKAHISLQTDRSVMGESTSQRDGWMGREARLVVAPTQNYAARLWAVLSVTPEPELL